MFDAEFVLKLRFYFVFYIINGVFNRVSLVYFAVDNSIMGVIYLYQPIEVHFVISTRS